jgi:hypothetical protein
LEKSHGPQGCLIIRSEAGLGGANKKTFLTAEARRLSRPLALSHCLRIS